MSLYRTDYLLSALLLVCTAGQCGMALADTNTDVGIPMPSIPLAQGENCVEDSGFMRRNHMDLLKHQRDETMLEGVRGKPYSLKDCLACHVVRGPDAVPVTVSSPQHFCRSCHDYAAVSIDCFQCHASRPDMAAGATR
ncbi:MAG: hypothetical protein OQJ84_12500 [Xanthomonadales bacterium]|nr:hypothetical protein [Xanthomonadales bacterium]